ncbi:MAG: hypothetical protein NTY19_00360, partial [Planctomycetota bacterium]|nr:hypothetical protein [Planctomycetota bacterium]
MTCQSLLTLLMNFGFLAFSVTDYVGQLTTLHILRLSKSSIFLVPTLCVGTQASDALRPWADDAGRQNTCVPTRRGCGRIVGWAKYSRPTIESKAIFLEWVGREYLAHRTV